MKYKDLEDLLYNHCKVDEWSTSSIEIGDIFDHKERKIIDEDIDNEEIDYIKTSAMTGWSGDPVSVDIDVYLKNNIISDEELKRREEKKKRKEEELKKANEEYERKEKAKERAWLKKNKGKGHDDYLEEVKGYVSPEKLAEKLVNAFNDIAANRYRLVGDKDEPKGKK